MLLEYVRHVPYLSIFTCLNYLEIYCLNYLEMLPQIPFSGKSILVNLLQTTNLFPSICQILFICSKEINFLLLL